MKFGTVIKKGVIILSALLLAACAKHGGGADNGGLSTSGLGDAFGSFGGQRAGEKYSTDAPSDQIYRFDYDNANLDDKYVPSVNAQANYLKNHPGARILIAGHTDERGSREYNIALGEHRANTVADVIRMSGVNRDQVRVVSYGKERPANLGHDEESHAQNRRAELTYESK
ncbi:MAG: peptidoglycan-associated lipoprotein Pal [Legionellaceae bacterium]|nr:peptidoglycan-associated lipoprotein Pal [Legionellaceae bacterium]MBP9775923.1 peptidoglycan-associated lipoprotein Pal [Legionellaceae bacterium]